MNVLLMPHMIMTRGTGELVPVPSSEFHLKKSPLLFLTLGTIFNYKDFTHMDVKFTKEQKRFTNENGQSVDYTQRNIVIDGTPFRVSKADSKVFDFQFKDEIEEL